MNFQRLGTILPGRLRRLLKRVKHSAVSVDMLDTTDAAVIERYNRAADHYFREIKDPTFVLNKPFGDLESTPATVYRFGILLAALDLGVHTVLDFGAGSCWVSSALNRMGAKTIAVDVSETALRLGQRLFAADRRHHMHLHPASVVYDGYTLPFRDQSIDRIICFDAFHHVPNKQRILDEMFRVLAQGGRAAFSEPGHHHSHSPAAVSEATRYGVLESDIDLDTFIDVAQRAGFDQIFVKPYPPAASVAFSPTQYRQFMGGDDRVFPLDVVRDDLRINTTVVLQRGTSPLDSRRPGVLKATLAMQRSVSRVRAGETYTVRFTVANVGDTIWRSAAHVGGGFVALGAHLLTADQKFIEQDYGRGYLSQDVHPGESLVAELALRAPMEPGTYLVEFDMVCEKIAWFGDRGSPTVMERFEVV